MIIEDEAAYNNAIYVFSGCFCLGGWLILIVVNILFNG